MEGIPLFFCGLVPLFCGHTKWDNIMRWTVRKTDLYQLDNTYEIPWEYYYCILWSSWQASLWTFIFCFSFNSKLPDTNFSNIILMLPEVHILYHGIIRFRWNIWVLHLKIFFFGSAPYSSMMYLSLYFVFNVIAYKVFLESNPLIVYKFEHFLYLYMLEFIFW